jgi:hypothetical protein
MSEENVVNVEETAPTEESIESQEVTTESVESTTEVEATPSLLDSFEYQYNKENVKPQSIEELKELAEMGRYYKEKGKSELESYKHDPSLSFVEKQAKKNNMDVTQYLEAVTKQEQYDEIQSIADNEGVSHEVANKLYNANKLEARVTKESNEAKTQAEQDARFDKFLNEYEGDVNNIPEALSKLWTETGDINEAHRQYKSSLKDSKIAELEEKLNIQNQNLSNSEASTGSVTGNGAPNGKMFTRDEVKSMSRDEVNKNYKKVTESMKTWK